MSENREHPGPVGMSWSIEARRQSSDDAFARLARARAEVASLRRELAARDALLRRLVGAAVCPKALAAALDAGADPGLKPTLRRVVILMSDLRGFSSLCERQPPLEVLDILHHLTTAMGAVVERYGGAVQDVHGDALVAVFGAFDERDDTLDRAVAAAIAMQNTLDDLNERHRLSGLPLLEMGVGLHAGEVAIGGVGADGWLRPIVVGSHANLASRVESFSVGGQILVSDAVAAPLAGRLRVGASFPATPKGFDDPVTVFDVQGLSGPYAIDLHRRPDELRALPEPLPVTLQIVDGKQVVGPLLSADLVRLSPRRAELRLARALRPLTDVRMSILPEFPGLSLYAKSLPGAPDGHVLFRFTSLPPVVRERIDTLVGQQQ